MLSARFFGTISRGALPGASSQLRTTLSSLSRSKAAIPDRKLCTEVKARDECLYILRSSVNTPRDELNTLESTLNAGFALLSADRKGYAAEAQDCFERAKQLDKDNSFARDIKCGKDQATDPTKKLCLHAYRP
ncbi:MAG: hypothetical protein DHS20C10_11610 [marine bacterium B5-7]|nr:MAG: hypothetical protein DHS20C10_11610 [marine bacterium B5-7]